MEPAAAKAEKPGAGAGLPDFFFEGFASVYL